MTHTLVSEQPNQITNDIHGRNATSWRTVRRCLNPLGLVAALLTISPHTEETKKRRPPSSTPPLADS
jgi:hypothetical protein